MRLFFRVLGGTLLASPMIAIFALATYYQGIETALIAFGAVVLVICVGLAGAWLLRRGSEL